MANPSNTKIIDNPASKIRVELKLRDMYFQFGGNFDVIITQNVGTETEKTLPVMMGRKSVDHNGIAFTAEDIAALIVKSPLFEELIPLFLEQAATEYTE